MLKSILRNYKLHASEVLYIGDETRDIEAAKECNIPVASVCWGLNTKMALKQLDPDYLIDSPSRLLEIIDLRKYQSTNTTKQSHRISYDQATIFRHAQTKN